ncbi:ATP-binding protein [Flaviflagellibacter deserti]|uniref:ATP-binding protein n=1 Tax=Flaviflagellibacter deserti TaxID=2267266 RepID=A0ABV9Z3C0_9HYPH
MPLQIQMTGELQLFRDGLPVSLPASKKTRALLGYLVATARSHRRERLCDIFWDGPDDPRGELRWSLSKIRPLVNDQKADRLVADREHVGIQTDAAQVDLFQIRSLVADDPSSTSTEALKRAVELFQGEFLDGLDLPSCYRFQEWCMAEREAVSRLRISVLGILIERLHDAPADALPYARQMVTADPLSEPGHASVVRLLVHSNRSAEALSYYEHARRILEIELSTKPGEELEEARRLLAPARRRVAEHTRCPYLAKSPRSGPSRALIGRHAERAEIDRLVSAALNGNTDVVLIKGEPGIGKSRMLDYVAETVAATGGVAFRSRAFQSEAIRPYGIWTDMLRTIARADATAERWRSISNVLTDGMSAPDAFADRSGLFEYVVDTLRTAAGDRPVAILVDDVQWLDEASAALLHYVARQCRTPMGFLLGCAARSGEIGDNAPVSKLLRALAREDRLREIRLAALSAQDTAALVQTVAQEGIDPSSIAAQSGGNPLFALELARTRCPGEISRTIETVIADQFASLTDHARDLLAWAAAFGRNFTGEDLARLGFVDPAELIGALLNLERRELIHPLDDGSYDFNHDLVRQAAYRTLSHPRRRLVHRHIARSLRSDLERDFTLAGELAHHAELAGDFEEAVRACEIAGQRALRLFANADAASLADRGLHHVQALADGPAKIEARMALLKVRLFAATGPRMQRLPPLAASIEETIQAAQRLLLSDVAATGHYLLSVLNQQAGQPEQAQKNTLDAAAAGRSAGLAISAHQLANTARCLLELETDVHRARTLIADASDLAASLDVELCELHWARGLLQRWDGEADAIGSTERALLLAQYEQDRWREYKCLTLLAMLALEDDRYSDVRARCTELMVVAKRLGDDETPFVSALDALALLASSAETESLDALDQALAQLRAVDDKSYLAYSLNSAARLQMKRGWTGPAFQNASAALSIASILHRVNEVTIARSLLAAMGDHTALGQMVGLARQPHHPNEISARALSAVQSALLRVLPSTMASTVRE